MDCTERHPAQVFRLGAYMLALVPVTGCLLDGPRVLPPPGFSSNAVRIHSATGNMIRAGDSSRAGGFATAPPDRLTTSEAPATDTTGAADAHSVPAATTGVGLPNRLPNHDPGPPR